MVSDCFYRSQTPSWLIGYEAPEPPDGVGDTAAPDWPGGCNHGDGPSCGWLPWLTGFLNLTDLKPSGAGPGGPENDDEAPVTEEGGLE